MKFWKIATINQIHYTPPLRKVCNFELQQIKQMNFVNREINQIHYTL